MPKYLIVFLFLVLFQNLKGQNVKKITLDEAINIALTNSEDIKNLELDEQIQHYKNKELTSVTNPQITGSAQGSYYFSTPQVQFPSSDIGIYEVLSKEGIKDGNGNNITVDKATFSTQNVSFFAPLNFQFGLGVSQLLFQPDVFVAYQARNTVIEFAKVNTAVAKDKVKEAVSKSYYNVLIAQSQKSVLIETMKRLEKLSSDMTQMYKSGFAEKLDIDKLQVTINNTKSTISQIDNGLKISQSLLKSSLGLNMSDSLVLIDQLNLEQLKMDLITQNNDFNYDNRNEVLLLNTAKKLQELDLRRHQLSKYPTAAAFLNYQRSGQRNTKFNPNDPWFWFSTGIVGVNVSIPIYDGGQRKHKITQSKLNINKVENSMAQVKRFIDLEQNIAKTSINNAIINLEVQQRNIKLAEEVFNTTKKKYEAGLGSSFELIQADTELQRANGGYFQALYDAYIARVSYYKSIGKL
jgi:outer membrane protein TolC